ncbi:hypothetical protein WICPIJ_003445 [Wickerhamomyces pijperi]|uniref:Uncharacterized protein n=1 Tax=Wickerhamomyces pijperi TaxID=599730 RepID=A0A9P8Q7C8_WICPI|nr:hypothetical protein WICPIJ_003445 [Wickerhamomyces pijperi]
MIKGDVSPPIDRRIRRNYTLKGINNMLHLDRMGIVRNVADDIGVPKQRKRMFKEYLASQRKCHYSDQNKEIDLLSADPTGLESSSSGTNNSSLKDQTKESAAYKLPTAPKLHSVQSSKQLPQALPNAPRSLVKDSSPVAESVPLSLKPSSNGPKLPFVLPTGPKSRFEAAPSLPTGPKSLNNNGSGLSRRSLSLLSASSPQNTTSPISNPLPRAPSHPQFSKVISHGIDSKNNRFPVYELQRTPYDPIDENIKFRGLKPPHTHAIISSLKMNTLYYYAPLKSKQKALDRLLKILKTPKYHVTFHEFFNDSVISENARNKACKVKLNGRVLGIGDTMDRAAFNALHHSGYFDLPSDQRDDLFFFDEVKGQPYTEVEQVSFLYFKILHSLKNRRLLESRS